MELHKLTEAEKSAARKMGKLPKAPKKPKQGATLKTLEAYVVRHNAYVAKVRGMAKSAGTRNALKKKIFGYS